MNEQADRMRKACTSVRCALADVREVHHMTTSVAVEELMIVAIEQLVRLSQLLDRLANAEQRAAESAEEAKAT
jgi:hypothetical protein